MPNEPPRRRKRLVVCADDYAFTPGVSRAIRELIAARRISATSVMAGSPFWPGEASALRAVAGDADIGLHVTLTDHKPIAPMPRFAPEGRLPRMADVYKAGLARRLPLDEIAAEINRQIEAFLDIWGRAPSHIDGHHHVQQLPGVRDLVITAAARLAREHSRPVWVRSGAESPTLVWRRGVDRRKAFVIGALGGAVARKARRAGVPTNRGFSGAYDFNAPHTPLADLFARFIAGAGDNALVMCHPGYADATLAALDVMTTARDGEQAFFLSDAWPAMVAAAGLEIGPYRHG